MEEAKAVVYDWYGTTSTDWANPVNWRVPAGLLGLPSIPANAPTPSDDVNIGVNRNLTDNLPTLSTTAACKSITIGGQIPLLVSNRIITLTINGNLTTGSITQATAVLVDYSVVLTGSGSLTCSSLTIGYTGLLASLLKPSTTIQFISTLNSLHITTGGVTINSTSVGLLGLIPLGTVNGNFSLQAGTTLIDGTIKTLNTPSIGLLGAPPGSPTFTIDMPPGSTANPILQLSNANAIDSASNVAGSIDFYNNTGGTGTCTVNYINTLSSNPTQTVYSTVNASTSSPSVNYLDASFALYQNLTFTGLGNKRANPGLITVAGTIDNSASSPIDFVTNTNTVQLKGTNQSIIGGTYTNTTLPNPTVGTVFYNLASSAATVILTGQNNIAPLGTLSFLQINFPTMTVNASAANSLTLLSTAAGDASIASLSTDASNNAITASVTGNINVQRYVRGGGGSTGPRRYMLLSSPVANVSATTYNLRPLFATTTITGPAGGGFDASPTNNPSVFIYDENTTTTANNNVVVGNEFKPFATMNETVPIGNGFEFYFRGSRSVTNPFVSPFPAPDNATLNFSGAVCTGSGANAPFTINVINFPTSPVPVYYSSSQVSTNTTLSHNSSSPTKLGLNLVGNPYPSAIDLNTVYSVNAANGSTYKFYYMLIKNASTGTNSYSTRYAIYDASANSVQAGASRYALSGQGFFIFAPNTSSTLLFNETMKAPYTAYLGAPSTIPIFNVVKSPSVLATTALSSRASSTQQASASVAASATQTSTNPIPRLRLELVRDTTVLNSTDINFDKTAVSKFKTGEDAPYIAASGQGDIFYSLTADSIGCFANYTADLEKIKRINLYTDFSAYGLYQLTSPVKSNIDERYTIYLKDKYTNDSLDVVHNSVYTFNITNNAASYAHDRFYLNIGIAPGHEYKLLSFTGTKVTTGIKLNWTTDNESNFTGFTLEKSTNGGTSFITIDTLQSTAAGTYTYTDFSPGIGQFTYRLVQTLVSGDTQVSKNLLFDYQDNNTSVVTFMVYPSSAAQDIHINLGKTYSNRIKINIISSTGSMVKTITATNTDAIQQNVGNLLKGLYIVEAIDEATGKKIGTSKFLKQ
jgi:hypothetical protein